MFALGLRLGLGLRFLWVVLQRVGNSDNRQFLSMVVPMYYHMLVIMGGAFKLMIILYHVICRIFISQIFIQMEKMIGHRNINFN